ncbi:hypothetical protein B5P42_22470 [Bacillus sp. SRB_331]|nr:hypothetical protein B5P42_22470 [Bacillus sp. SRB_331]
MHFFIHSYTDAVLGFLFVTGLAEKLYKILYTLSVGFFRNVSDTPGINLEGYVYFKRFKI